MKEKLRTLAIVLLAALLVNAWVNDGDYQWEARRLAPLAALAGIGVLALWRAQTGAHRTGFQISAVLLLACICNFLPGVAEDIAEGIEHRRDGPSVPTPPPGFILDKRPTTVFPEENQSLSEKILSPPDPRSVTDGASEGDLKKQAEDAEEAGRRKVAKVVCVQEKRKVKDYYSTEAPQLECEAEERESGGAVFTERYLKLLPKLTFPGAPTKP